MSMELKKQKKNFTITFDIIKEKIISFVDVNRLDKIDTEYLLDKIQNGWCDDSSTNMLISYVCETAASMMTIHPQYGDLGSKVLVWYTHEITPKKFSEKIVYIQKHRNIIKENIYKLVINNKDKIDEIMDYSKDYDLSYFSLVSLLKSYLVKVNDVPVESPQDMFMRVSLQLHHDNWELVRETYEMMKRHYFTHATPTLYNACMTRPQLASCFLLTPKGDSIEGLYDTLKECSLIMKYSGGIGLSLHSIRARGSALKTTGGKSPGIIPYVQVLNATKKHINQGGGKRSSSISIYLEPWHKDIFDFLDLRKNTGQEELRARDIFIALWICDLFMDRVDKDEEWSLFCPNDAKDLSDVWGNEFNKLYCKYEKTKNRVVVKARKLWKAIIETQIETGTPYMVYKDTCNRCSNQQNLGTIRSSNLCAEIIEYSSPNEIAVCNLTSICLPKFVENGEFNYKKLRDVVRINTKNLNNCIDLTFYPVQEAESSNKKHRPIAIGVQGLADLFAIMRYPFDSEEARKLNYKIFENMYYAALDASCDIAKEQGPYESYQGSPMSKGLFHFELCNHRPENMEHWDVLRAKIMKYGIRNSLFVALMPTASTSQIYNNNECFEPFTSNIYTRRTHAGEFQIINRHLLKDLVDLNLWNSEMKNLIIEYEGSIQNITTIPEDIRNLYKTAWELKMKSLIDLAADRQVFIDQSQSLNLFVAKPTYSQLSSMHFYAYRRGLKTGLYYLRTRPITSAIRFTVDQKQLEKTLSSMNTDTCDMCSA